MKLKNIKAENIKGRNIDVTLGPVNVFVGPSFSGKTAILDAIKIGLLGYHPSLGKRPQAAFALANGAAMSVNVEFENTDPKTPNWFRHQWQVERGSVKYTGPDKLPSIPAVLLDVREYLGLSGPDRLKYMFERAAVGDAVTAADLFGQMNQIEVKEGAPAQLHAAIAEAIQIVGDLDTARHEEGVTVQTWLETVLDQFKAAAKDSGDAVKRMQGLVQGSVDLKAQAAAPKLANVDADLASARKKLDAARIDLDRALQDQSKETKRKARIEALKSEVLNVDPAKVTELKSVIEAKRLSITGYKSRTIELHAPAADGRAKIAGLERDEKRITLEIEDEKAQHSEQMKLKCCPFCKSDRKGWTQALEKAHVAAIDTKEVALTQTRKALEKQQAALEKATVALGKSEALDAANGTVLDEIAALEDQCSTWNATLQQHAAARAELAVLEGQVVPVLNAAELSDLRLAVTRLQGDVAALDLRQKQYVAGQQAEVQSAKARAELERQRVRSAVFKAGVELVRDTQQKCVDGAIGALLGTARKFTDGIMPGKLDYRDGDIGYWAGSTWVSHSTFSGTEEALSYAAFSVALAAESEVRLVLIDELGIADGATKNQIIGRMVELVAAGVIEQFIGCDVSKADYVGANGVTVHEVTR